MHSEMPLSRPISCVIFYTHTGQTPARASTSRSPSQSSSGERLATSIHTEALRGTDCAMTSRTNGTLQHTIVDSPGGRYAPLPGTTPTTRDGEISCRGQNRGDLPRAVVLEKLALQVEKALPSN